MTDRQTGIYCQKYKCSIVINIIVWLFVSICDHILRWIIYHFNNANTPAPREKPQCIHEI